MCGVLASYSRARWGGGGGTRGVWEVGRKVGGRARKWGGGQIRVEEEWESNKLVSSLPIYHFLRK